VIQDNHGAGITLGGRVLSVAMAVDRGEAHKLQEDNKTKKEKEDKRNLYLAREGGKQTPLFLFPVWLWLLNGPPSFLMM